MNAAEVLAEHQPAIDGFACRGCDWSVRNPSVTDDTEWAEHQLAALKAAGYAVVELPEPIEREDEDQNFTDFPGVGLYVPVVFDEHPGEVQIRAGAWCDEPLSVVEARELAASILAAAAAAEAALPQEMTAQRDEAIVGNIRLRYEMASRLRALGRDLVETGDGTPHARRALELIADEYESGAL